MCYSCFFIFQLFLVLSDAILLVRYRNDPALLGLDSHACLQLLHVVFYHYRLACLAAWHESISPQKVLMASPRLSFTCFHLGK
jgi:hypothetical protein